MPRIHTRTDILMATMVTPTIMAIMVTTHMPTAVTTATLTATVVTTVVTTVKERKLVYDDLWLRFKTGPWNSRKILLKVYILIDLGTLDNHERNMLEFFGDQQLCYILIALIK